MIVVSITEQQRHQLIRALERELGEEEAAWLMELVPQIPWTEFAIQRRVDERFDRVDVRFDRMEERYDREFALVRAEIGRLEARTEAMIADAVNQLTFRLLPAMAMMIAMFGAIASVA